MTDDRTNDSTDAAVTDNPELHRFEVYADGRVAGFADYRLGDGVIDFVHTEIDDAFSGRGLGKVLVTGALDSARASGLQVLPHCGFFASFIAKNREYADLVPAERHAEFNLA